MLNQTLQLYSDREHSMKNQFRAGNKAGPSHQVEPEKEKNPQQVEPEAGEIIGEKEVSKTNFSK